MTDVATVRPLEPDEHDEMLDHRWTCARCPDMATHRVVGPGAFRLCGPCAELTAAGLATLAVGD